MAAVRKPTARGGAVPLGGNPDAAPVCGETRRLLPAAGTLAVVPELPEVETVMRGLQPFLEGCRLTRVETRRGALRLPFPPDFARRLTGRRVLRLRRRAKYLLADLDSADTLVMHLGMSGRIAAYGGAGGAPDLVQQLDGNIGGGRHDHVVFETDAPARIVFTDQRRFGLMTIVETAALDQHPLFRHLGVEPLSPKLNPRYLRSILAGKKTPIKSALLDQRVIAGLGNIYVCEALWRSRISPKRPAGRVKPAQIAELVPAIRQVLREAIRAGGSTLRDHRQPNGELGYFQARFRVYDREGEPCPRPGCPGRIRRIVQTGRSTFYCPKCQV